MAEIAEKTTFYESFGSCTPGAASKQYLNVFLKNNRCFFPGMYGKKVQLK
jgi:hypothetical protein